MENKVKNIMLIVPSKEFNLIEYNIVRSALEDAGCRVFVTSDNPVEAVAEDGTGITVDTSLEGVETGKYDGVYVIGGPAAVDCLNIPSVYRILKDARDMDIPFGAIDTAARILCFADVVVGRDITGLNTDGMLERIATEHGARYRRSTVEVDGYIVTGTGPEDSKEFAKKVLHSLELKAKGVPEELPKKRM